MNVTDPTTAQPATPGQPEPDHIPADTDRVEAGILAEFDLSPLRDLALDLLHDLVQTRAEVRRLRAQTDARDALETIHLRAKHAAGPLSSVPPAGTEGDRAD